MDTDRVCQNCSFFFSDNKESEPGWGVCMNGPTFEPYADSIVEEDSSFQCCYALYNSKRYDGDRDACGDFEEIETIEYGEEEAEFDPDKHIEMLRNQDVKSIIDVLYESDKERQTRAVRTLETYICFGNEGAYRGLLDYYKQLPAAEDLEDVHYRVVIVEVLSHTVKQKDTIDAFVHELARTPSNQTTRQLYSLIIKELRRCDIEMIEAPIMELLKLRKFGPKMENKLMDLLTDRNDDWRGFWPF